MVRTPRIDARKISSVIERYGYKMIRQRGSHRIYENSDGIRVVLPVHSGAIIHPKIVTTISRDTGIPIEEFS